MGYRFVLKRFKYSKEVRRNQKLAFESWWENKGVAPCYENYPLAIRLHKDGYQKVFITEADIREWLPGDNLYNDAVYIPSDVPVGDYELEIAIVGKNAEAGEKPRPKIKIAIAGMNELTVI